MIALAQLREPARPTRSNIDEGALDELAASIRDVGIVSPLIVFPVDAGAFEIGAGHRRFLAGRRAGLVEFPCVVRTDAGSKLAVRVHENMGRVDLTPVEEAVFYAEQYEELGQDTDRVAEAVRRPREHVERRLALLTGDKAILEALERSAIPLGVAEEFNRMVRAEDRAYYLDHAIRSGCSIRQAREWRGQANALAASRAALDDAATAPSPSNGPAPAAPIEGPHYAHLARPYELSASTEERPCLFCGEPHPEWRMYRKFVCAPCADRHLVPAELQRPAVPRTGGQTHE